MFIVYGQRYHAYEPFVLTKDIAGVGEAGDVLDDGQPKKIILGRWDDEKIAQNFAANIKASVPKRSWNVWVE
jgi:hypothetical protein